ncbi:MAG: LamG domain-containing protein [bacterium]|nr:LamG domain-containing protein [bacterium]
MRKLISGIVCSVILICLVSTCDADLIAQWNFSEGSGTTVSDSVGTYNGELHGKVLWVADTPPVPESKMCLETGGTGSDYVDMGISSALSPSSITVSLWAKGKADGSSFINQTLIGKYSAVPGSYELSFTSSDSTGKLCFRAFNSQGSYRMAGNTAAAPFTAAAFNDGKWHHFAGTMDQATGAVSLYVDGSLVETLYLTAGYGLNSTSQPLYIGRRPFPTSQCPFKGRIANVSIYNTALSAVQVKSLTAKGGLASWKLGQRTGSSVADILGRYDFSASQTVDYDGTINGNVSWITDAPFIPGNDYAALFGGTGSDYIDMGTSSALSPSSITVSLWAKGKADGSSFINQTLIGKYSAVPGSYELSFSASDNSGKLCFRAFNSQGSYRMAGNTAAAPFTAAAFNDGKWHHFAGTMDQATGAVSLYVDGSLVETLYLTAGYDLNSTSQPLYIGRRPFPSSQCPFKGRMANVTIYDTALTATEIAALASEHMDKVNPGFYGRLGDFTFAGSYPAYFNTDYFERHNIKWFWLGHQWVVPYLLASSQYNNNVPGAVNQFKQTSKIWYELFWWGDHTQWNGKYGFANNSLPSGVVADLANQGHPYPGGDNLLGNSWHELAANDGDNALMDSAKKTIRWQLDTIFQTCGTDALYGVVLSEEEPHVCFSLNNDPANGYEIPASSRAEFSTVNATAQQELFTVMNILYDYVKDYCQTTYGVSIKVAPGIYPQWVIPVQETVTLKYDAAVMDLYPNFGAEADKIREWLDAWGQNTEQYILIDGYGDLDRYQEIDRFDKLIDGLTEYNLRNIGFFYPSLSLEDRIYRVCDVWGTDAAYDATGHSTHVSDMMYETTAAAEAFATVIPNKLPSLPSSTVPSNDSRKNQLNLLSSWYDYRERVSNTVYDDYLRMGAYLYLQTISDILYAEGFLTDSSYQVNNTLTPGTYNQWNTWSRGCFKPDTPDAPPAMSFYNAAIPAETTYLSDMATLANGICMRPDNGFSQALLDQVSACLTAITNALDSGNCTVAYTETTGLYNLLRANNADRSYKLYLKLINNYGYSLSVQVGVAVDYGSGFQVLRSDRPFENSSAGYTEWTLYLKQMPEAVHVYTGSWTGSVPVNPMQLSNSQGSIGSMAYTIDDPVYASDGNPTVNSIITGTDTSYVLRPYSSYSGIILSY